MVGKQKTVDFIVDFCSVSLVDTERKKKKKKKKMMKMMKMMMIFVQNCQSNPFSASDPSVVDDAVKHVCILCVYFMWYVVRL